MIALNSHVWVNFSIKWSTPQQSSIYLIGNVPELGKWEVQKAISLNKLSQNNWSISIKFIKFQDLQYKFFMSNSLKIDIDNIKYENKKACHKLTKGQVASDQRLLTSICSFNIRYLTPKDVDNTHWNQRKIKIIDYISQLRYDFVGIQEATLPQRKYLQQNLKEFYQYFGKTRKSNKDQQCGILVKKDKYSVLEDYCDWISQSGKQDQIGYDGKLARHFTSLLAVPKIVSSNEQKVPCLFVVNLHLDHKGKVAKTKGLQQIIQKCIQIKNKMQLDKTYQLAGCIVMGDFNIKQGRKQLKLMNNNKNMIFKSMRQIEGADKSFTFNAFDKQKMLKVGEYVENNDLTIDHMYYWANKQQKLIPTKFLVDKCLEQNFLSDHYAIVGTFKFANIQ